MYHIRVIVILTSDQVLRIIVAGAHLLYSLNVTYHIRVTVTLTFDLVLRMIVSGAHLLYSLR